MYIDPTFQMAANLVSSLFMLILILTHISRLHMSRLESVSPCISAFDVTNEILPLQQSLSVPSCDWLIPTLNVRFTVLALGH